MFGWFFDLLRDACHRIDYAMNHMSVLQWSIVSITAVVVGFLALRSRQF